MKTAKFDLHQQVTLHWNEHNFKTQITRRFFDPDADQWFYQLAIRGFGTLVTASHLSNR